MPSQRIINKLQEAIIRAEKGIFYFIQPIGENGEYDPKSEVNAFNYSGYTDWCLSKFNVVYDNINDVGLLVRDIALEKYDPDYNFTNGSLKGMKILC